MKGIGMVKGGKSSFKMPTLPKLAKPARVHPSAQPRVRLPQGMADVKGGDPGVYLPDVGKV